MIRKLKCRRSDLWFLIPISLILAAGTTIARKPDLGETAAVSASPDPSQGTELVMVFIGSANCTFSPDESMPSLLARMKATLKETAQERGQRFVTIGIAVDRSPEQGISYLRQVGPFDELLVGRSWLGTGAIKYLIRDVPGYAGVPQVVVVERDVEFSGGYIHVSDERLIARKAGLPQLTRWVEQGAPLRFSRTAASEPSATM